VINLQGDLPTIDPKFIRTAYEILQNPDIDIGTLGTPITDESELINPNVVKIINNENGVDFVRTLKPDYTGPAHHHIGLYTYRRDALEKFVNAPPSDREKN